MKLVSYGKKTAVCSHNYHRFAGGVNLITLVVNDKLRLIMKRKVFYEITILLNYIQIKEIHLNLELVIEMILKHESSKYFQASKIPIASIIKAIE